MAKGLTDKLCAPNKIKQRQDIFLAFCTVILFYLAFPSGDYGNLAWLAIMPVIIALNNTQGKYPFMLGLLTATLGWMCSIWWVVEGLTKVTFSQSNIVIPFVFLFCIFSALPYAISCWLHARFSWGNSIFGAFKSACIFTVLVNFIPSVLPGNLAHALYLSPLQIQLIDIGGVPILFFIIHLVNFLLATAFINRKIDKQKSITCLLLALSIWLLNYGYGYIKTTYLLNKTVSVEMTVAIIQPNLAVSLRTRNDWLKKAPLFQSLISEVVSEHHTDLIVLPEIPVPVSYENYQQDKLIFDPVIKNRTVLITAIEPINNQLTESAGYHNTIELIERQQLTQLYKKQKLLPIGEYLPFEKQLPILRTLFPNAPNYVPGKNNTLMPFELEGQTINIVPLICYEAVFTDLVADGVTKGGQVLINTVNDAWFGDTAGRNVHLALALYRTIEYRKPLIRVTNNGVSNIINVKGQIIPDSQIKPLTVGVSVSKVDIPEITSFYQVYPDFFIIFCLLFCSYAIVSSQRKLNE